MTPAAKIGGAIAASLLLLFAAFYGLAHRDYKRDMPPAPTFVLHSAAPFQAVRVPFTLKKNGAIFVPVEVSGKTLNCQIDTGSPVFLWDKTLNLRGTKTGYTIWVSDAANEATPNCEQVILPQVRMGNYEVGGVSTFAMDTGRDKKAVQSMVASLVDTAPLIGHEAFAGVVLTIDYHEKTLLLRDKSYDFTQKPLPPRALVLPFTLPPHEAFLYGDPVVEGTINGVSARVSLDTGWPNDSLLDARFAEKAFSTKPEEDNGIYFYPPARITLGENRLPTPFSTRKSAKNTSAAPVDMPMIAYPDVPQDFDVNLGYFFLRFFRITFDYGRKRILLEPYDETVVQILPKGARLARRLGRKLRKEHFDTDMVIFHYADKTTTVTPL